jgi:acetylornithine deacetylase
MTDPEILAFHRDLVATRSISGDEGPIADLVQSVLAARGIESRRLHDNVWAVLGGTGPILCLNSHLDTVPPAPGWTFPPWTPTIREGRVYGLGSNDAKASVAAMTAAFLRILGAGGLPGARLVLALAASEETGGAGTEVLVPAMRREGFEPDAAVVGEPTGLDVAIAQKGHLVLDLVEKGTACHAAHGQALGAANALRLLALDLVALDGADLGPLHLELGPVTLEPTTIRGGSARNVIPAEASCTLDVRTNPGESPERLVERLRSCVEGHLALLGTPLPPCEIDREHPLVRAALAARPTSIAFGSRGVSDWVHFGRVPTIKVGPGRTERSHTPDEYVRESEILEGARFYQDLATGWAAQSGRQGRAP